MRYLVNLTSNVNDSLEEGNYRGEGRWERHVVSALIKNNKDIHLTRPAWQSEENKPANVFNGINQEWLDDSVLITHGISTKLHIDYEVNKYIVQLHESLTPETVNKFKSYGDKIIATTDSQNPFTFNKLKQQLGPTKVHYLAGPMVPYVDLNANNFRKPFLTWSYRNFWSYIEGKGKDLSLLADLLKSYMIKEPELRIKIIVGLWDIWGPLSINPTSEVLKEWAFSHKTFKCFEAVKDRIDFYANLHWSEVIEILKYTRYIISPAEPLGCPAFEAAMFGIPTVVNSDVNPFMTSTNHTFFAEVLKTQNAVNSEFLTFINKLQTDKTFYEKHGNAYRNWVNNNATYDAYVKKIDSLL